MTDLPRSAGRPEPCRSLAAERGLCAIALAWMALGPGQAGADSPYCVKVLARAGEDATVLTWPRLFTEGLRFPGNAASQGPTLGDNLQLWLGLSFSPTDAYRGAELRSAAYADCRFHGASEGIGDLIEATQSAALPALRAQVDALESHRPRWVAILTRAQERLHSGWITAAELEALRKTVLGLERKAESVRGEAERVEARSRPGPRVQVDGLVDSLVRNAVDYEQALARARVADAVQVRLRGGVIPGERTTDWFARVEISFSLGAIARSGDVSRYLEARRQEIETARYELPARAAAQLAEARARLWSARRMLTLVEADAASIEALLGVMQTSTTPESEQTRAMLELERISVKADQAFLTAWIEGLSQLLEPAPTAVQGATSR